MKNSTKKLQVNCNKFVQFFLLAIILSLSTPQMISAQDKTTDFSGNWAFNESKSDLGDGGRRFGGGDLVAKQDGNMLTVDRSFTNRNGESSTFTSKYSLDGKETTNSFGRGESKSTTEWSSDGKSLTINTTMSFNGNDWTSTDIWTLSDKNTLSVQSTRPSRDGGERKSTRVYDKK